MQADHVGAPEELVQLRELHLEAGQGGGVGRVFVLGEDGHAHRRADAGADLVPRDYGRHHVLSRRAPPLRDGQHGWDCAAAAMESRRHRRILPVQYLGESTIGERGRGQRVPCLEPEGRGLAGALHRGQIPREPRICFRHEMGVAREYDTEGIQHADPRQATDVGRDVRRRQGCEILRHLGRVAQGSPRMHQALEAD